MLNNRNEAKTDSQIFLIKELLTIKHAHAVVKSLYAMLLTV